MSSKKTFNRIETFGEKLSEASIQEILKEIRFMSLEIGDTRLVYSDGINSCLFTEEFRPFLVEMWKSLATWIGTRHYWLKQNHELKKENERLTAFIRAGRKECET